MSKRTFLMARVSVAVLCALTLAACSTDPTPISQIKHNDTDMGDGADMTMTPDMSAPSDMDTRPDMMTPPDMGADMSETPCEMMPDEPDKMGEDTNCDGIDGDEAASVFVATYGDDQNPGTKTLPKLTITAAINAAVADPAKSWVLVETGNYEEALNLSNGVSISGGYAFGWKRDPRGFSTVRQEQQSSGPTISGDGLTEPTRLLNLEVRPPMSVPEAGTAITIALTNSPGATLERVRVIGGFGGSGVSGVMGSMGAMGKKGGDGDDGNEDGSLTCRKDGKPDIPSGGAAVDCGGGVFSLRGGKGGEPGLSKDNGGKKGEAGPGGGGTAGTAGTAKNNGGEGGDGDPGDPGDAGVGGSSEGHFEGTLWVGRSGQTGVVGDPGKGGGGGGGGGGAGGSFGDCQSWGGSGGGGGSGGCGGTGGTGGGPGGASVAIFLVDSDIFIDECKITIGTGGTGGGGGLGGPGGPGGLIGKSSTGEDGSGGGGPGGPGGAGGQGGGGGGGAGGPAFGVYTNQALTNDPVDTEFIPGTAGAGGNGFSVDGRGATGLTADLHVGAGQ